MCKPYDLTETLVAVDDVHSVRGDEVVLRGITATIRNIVRPDVLAQGQVVGVLGPSGIGKTTLFRILAGLEEPTRGRVLLTEAQLPVRAGMVGVVHQNYPLLAHRRVLGNLVVAAQQGGLSRSDGVVRALAMLERFSLADHADAWPAELSGGQRQRVAIIQQLLCGHTYLLMDEPFSGLDPICKHKTCALITEVAQTDEHETLVIVTHDIREAIKVSDTLWLLGRERTVSGEIIPGSRIVATYNLIERDLAWHPGIERTLQFAELVREIEDRFERL